jgi:hypothetical protein
MFGIRDVSITPLVVSVGGSNAFTTLADVKSFLGITVSTYDTLLTEMIDTACQNIEAWCGALLAQRTVTETIFPEDQVTNLVLSHAPVISLTSLSVDDVAETIGDYFTGLSTGFVKRKDGGYITDGTKWVVVYSAGLSTIPEALKQATREYVRDLYQTKDRVAGVSQEAITDVGSVTYTDAIDSEAGAGGGKVPLSVATLLAPYVRRFGI